ncbi:Conserved_hypothetical protein [Hexamita inflata]|uniref:Uncharacterized protein n=1 Tax=Hexamita inflata TaxID=28002 RepID=A0AA86UZS6_9EUKA|nr:Conserved hypothetical protein [Hexamita inflata]
MTNKTFEVIQKKFYEKEKTGIPISPYLYFNKKFLYPATKDAAHSGKRQKNKLCKNFISLSMKLDNMYINVDDVAAVMGFKDQNIFTSTYSNKMCDEFMTKAFSSRVVTELSRGLESVHDMHYFLYFLLHFIYATPFCKINSMAAQEYYIFILFTLLQYYEKQNEFKVLRKSVGNGEEEVMRPHNYNSPSVLTAYDKKILKDTICYVAKVLYACERQDIVRVISAGSFLVEIQFSKLRRVCLYDHSICSASRALEQMLVLDYCDQQLGDEIIPNRLGEHKTLIINSKLKPSSERIDQLFNLSVDVIDLIFNDYPKNISFKTDCPDKLNNVVQFWDYIQDNVSEEPFWKTEECFRDYSDFVSGFQRQERTKRNMKTEGSKVVIQHIIDEYEQEEEIEEQ